MWPFKKKENRAAASGDPQWLKDLIEGGSSSATGRKVTADTAMQASAVYACFPSGALIKTPSGWLEKIDDVIPSDSVVTHLGTTSEVTEKLVREYTGDLFTIKRWGGDKIDVTSEHPFFVLKKPSYSRWYRTENRYDNIVYEWVKACDLKNGDYLVEPIQNDIINCKSYPVFTKTRIGGKGKGPHYGFKKEYIQINDETMRLIGYFLAEGFTNCRSVKFVFSKKETEYHDDLKGLMLLLFGVEAKIYPCIANGESVVFTFNNVKAVEFFSQFGKTAKNKYIPSWILTLPLGLQKQLLKGLWRGDGCQATDGFNIDTASCQLAEGVKAISLRLGMIPSKIKKTETVLLPKTKDKYGGKNIKRTIYKLFYRGKNALILSDILHEKIQITANRSYTFIANGYAHYPIRDISTSKVKNLIVYNLEVANEQSYICEGVAVHNCVRVLAETVASLPLNVYKRLRPTGKEKAIDHNLYSVLHDAPNPEITSLEFREAMQAHLCLRGNAYAEKVFDGAGRLRQLWPISPDRVSVERDRITKQLVYTVTLPESAGQVRLTTKNMFHLRGLSGDGIVGYSPIKLFKESIGLSLAAEEYGARFFGNSLRPSGVFEHPNKLGKQAQDNLVKSMQEQHQELSKKFRVMVLEEGMKWHQMSISPEEAQFLQTRQFQVVDIARIFRVPPHLIAELSRATFSNIEQQSIDFVVNTIRPWLVRWEQAIKQRLFDTDEIEYFAEFVVDGLLRGDIASRYTAYSVGRQNGWLSADDIRDLENMNPLPNGEGKTYLLPLNMVPVDQSAKVGDMAKDKGLQDDKKKQRTSNAFRRIFQDALTRIVKRERADVLRQIKKYAQRQSIKDFETWLDDFYSEHVDFIKRNISPVITSYYEIVESTGIDLDERINDYTLRHIYSSKKQIRGIVNSSGVDLEKALTDMFDVWEGQRIVEVAAKEIAITGAVND